MKRQALRAAMMQVYYKISRIAYGTLSLIGIAKHTLE